MSLPQRDLLEELTTELQREPSARDELTLRSALHRNKVTLFQRMDRKPAGDLRAWKIAGTLTLAASIGWMCRHTPQRAPAAALAATIVSQPTGPAEWNRHTDGKVESVVLTAGTLSLQTRGSHQGPVLRVFVPDGEIEDIGTAFRVTVQNTRTVSIEVSEGLVVFHRNDGNDVRLPAGTSWTALPETSAWKPVPQASEVAHKEPPAARSLRHAPPSAVASTEPHDVGADEDALYLRIGALLQEGRRAEARLAAREYVVRFPRGFRHVEVERLLRAD